MKDELDDFATPEEVRAFAIARGWVCLIDGRGNLVDFDPGAAARELAERRVALELCEVCGDAADYKHYGISPPGLLCRLHYAGELGFSPLSRRK